MQNNKVVVSSGFSLGSVLGVAFVILKLCNVINWSWWLVLLPFYAVPGLLIGAGLVCLLVAGILAAYDGIVALCTRKRR
jgi:hypothetical protein